MREVEMSKKKNPMNRYFHRVARDRERIEREERLARGEKTENEKFAADLLERIRAK